MITPAISFIYVSQRYLFNPFLGLFQQRFEGLSGAENLRAMIMAAII